MQSAPRPDSQTRATTGSVIIEIGGIALALYTTDHSFRDLLNQRYSAFVKSSGSVHSEFNIELIEELIAPQAETHRDEDLQVHLAAGRWIIQRGDFHAEWDSETGRGIIRQSANPYSADAVLRIVHSLILARHGGFLLHAASAVLAGNGFLFSGISGAGKTTISALAPSDAILLTDEISYVKPAGGGYRIFGTPFAGELAKLGENVSAPLSTLFFLEKGPGNRIGTVPPDQATRLLLRNILFFANDAELVDLVFQAACDFVERVPVRRLIFAPDARVWETIRAVRN